MFHFRLIRFALVAAFALLTVGTTTSSAALPCNLQQPVDLELSPGEPHPGPPDPRPLEVLLDGNGPADRNGAVNVTSDAPRALRFNLIGAGENIFRCIDYGQDRVLIDNTSQKFRESRGVDGYVDGGMELVQHGEDGSIYTETVGNPLELADGRYLVDYIVQHDGNWLSGELVFALVDDEFDLDAAHLADIEPVVSAGLEITITHDGPTDEAYSVAAGADIRILNTTDADIEIHITSEETDEAVYKSNVTPINQEGPDSRDTIPLFGLSPGEYTATITTEDGDEYVVAISVDD